MKNIIQHLSLLSIICLFVACKKEETVSVTKANSTDADLLQKSNSKAGFIWYNLQDSLYKRSSGSGHGQAFFRTRFNSIAATKLNSEGRVMPDAQFPEGSLIVKELYKDAQTLDQYAILYKDSKNTDADAKGWVWGYIKPSGTIVVSASQKGNSCINCHSQSGNIDYVLMNKFY